MPQKDGGNGKWFIRPHHLETLTQHPLSIKDDVLNTRYYSHYDQNYGKKEEKNINADAIVKIEEHLAMLKGQMSTILMKRGQFEDPLEELYEKTKMQAAEEFEKFINDKTRQDSKQLIITAYEEILRDRRQREKEVLNG
jgi:hypothetical protein